MFSNTARPSSMALTMLAKLSSSRMMSAASLATSVPDRPIAMPMSAALSAGASLTPSPVTATTSPFLCSAWTMNIFCTAVTRANRISGASRAICSCAGVIVRDLVAAHDERLGAAHDADLARDGDRRMRIVAGDHDDLDAGLAAARRRGRHFGPGRILEPDEPARGRAVPRRPAPPPRAAGTPAPARAGRSAPCGPGRRRRAARACASSGRVSPSISTRSQIASSDSGAPLQ